jgi:hypothetical protein
VIMEIMIKAVAIYLVADFFLHTLMEWRRRR